MSYYSDDAKIEAMMIEEFGIPDQAYDAALQQCLSVDVDKTPTEELYAIVSKLEPNGYFEGRKTREFIVAYIRWQRERARDAQGFAQSPIKEHKKSYM